ncbi:MAG: hypothetical protein PHE67_11650 [Campylobacterales bacterium]|nr:hypothetical protein [Campylobacterales bacterium]
MKSSTKISLNSKVIDLKILENKSVIVALEGGQIKLISNDGSVKDYRMQNSVSGKKGAFRSFERDGTILFAFISEGSKKITIYDLTNKTQLLSHTSENQIVFLDIDYSGEILFYYTDDFKLNTFEITNNRVISSIFIEKDFVPSRIRVNSDMSRVALVTDAGRGYVCSPAALKVLGSFSAQGYDNCFAGFLEENYFCSVSREGIATIIDTDTMKSSKVTMRFPSFCKKGFFMDENRLFLGVFKDGKIGVYDVEEEKVTCMGRLDSVLEHTDARFDEQNLFLATLDVKDNLNLYDVEAEFLKFKTLFSTKAFFACYKMFDECELLCITDAPKMLEDVFSAFAMNALKLAEAENYDGAVRQLSPFLNVAAKKDELKEIIDSIETMRSFIGFIKTKKFSNAYNLAERYRFLKLSGHYKNMEEEWSNALARAEALSLAGKLEEAKESLSAYRGVSSKTEIIKQIVAERETINLFLKKIAAKDFKAAFELANIHPFLKELKEYRTLKDVGEKGMQKIKEFLESGDIQKAKDTISLLKAIPIFRHDAETIEKRVIIYQKFFDYKKTNDETKIKIFVKKYPFLEQLV